MNVKIYKAVEVARPDTIPLRSNLFDHFPVKINDRFGLRNDEGLWITYNDLDFNYGLSLCSNGDLEYSSGFWVSAEEFVLQSGVQCSAVGTNADDQKAEVKRVFGLVEARGIESLLTGSTHFGAAIALPASGVTGAFSPHVALAQLEGQMAASYAGVPTIHMPRAAMSLLGGRIKWQGNQAWTDAGSKVVAGGGYDVSDSGHYQMYATGEAYIEATEEIDVQSWVVPHDGSVSQGINAGDNTVLTIAERMYRVAFDGPIYTATAVVF